MSRTVLGIFCVDHLYLTLPPRPVRALRSRLSSRLLRNVNQKTGDNLHDFGVRGGAAECEFPLLARGKDGAARTALPAPRRGSDRARAEGLCPERLSHASGLPPQTHA